MNKKYIFFLSLLFVSFYTPIQSMLNNNDSWIIIQSNDRSIEEKAEALKKIITSEKKPKESKEKLLESYYWIIINDEHAKNNYTNHSHLLSIFYNNGYQLDQFECIFNRPKMHEISTAGELDIVISNVLLLLTSYLRHNASSTDSNDEIYQPLIDPQTDFNDLLNKIYKNTKKNTFPYICSLLKTSHKPLASFKDCIVIGKNTINQVKTDMSNAKLSSDRHFNRHMRIYDENTASVTYYEPYVEFLNSNPPTPYNYLLAHIQFLIDFTDGKTLNEEEAINITEIMRKEYKEKIRIFDHTMWDYTK